MNQSLKFKALREANKAFRIYETDETNEIVRDMVIVLFIVLMFSTFTMSC